MAAHTLLCMDNFTCELVKNVFQMWHSIVHMVSYTPYNVYGNLISIFLFITIIIIIIIIIALLCVFALPWMSTIYYCIYNSVYCIGSMGRWPSKPE